MNKGIVFDIQRMSVHDGPGIRTTVFLKGCPLRCLWCHNPESGSKAPELAFHESQCIGCGECLTVCENHRSEDGKHLIDRENCRACGECAEACTGALELLGKEMDVSQVMNKVLRDRAFYASSGGGLTLSGGEPLMQAEFALAILKKAKEEGLHTCLETTGFVKREVLLSVLPYVDLFLYDYKETDSARHKEFTGAGNELILENLFALDEAGASIILRCPMIPGLNDTKEHLFGIAKTANQLKNIQMIHIEPYNSFGEGKSESIGKVYPLKGLKMPEDETVAEWIKTVSGETSVPTVKN